MLPCNPALKTRCVEIYSLSTTEHIQRELLPFSKLDFVLIIPGEIVLKKSKVSEPLYQQ